MAKAANAGWIVAGFATLALLGQCMKGNDVNGSATASTTLSSPARPPSISAWKYVHAENLNCRAGRGTDAARVRSLGRNDYVGVIEEQDGWSLIQGSPTCWASSRHLASDRMPAPPVRSQIQRAYGGGSNGSTSSSRSTRSSRSHSNAGSCPCRGNNVCIGPRGGRYCITSGGNKRYGV